MDECIKVSDLPEFDAAQYLDSDETIAAYLNDIIEADNTGLLASALDDVTQARLERKNKHQSAPAAR